MPGQQPVSEVTPEQDFNLELGSCTVYSASFSTQLSLRDRVCVCVWITEQPQLLQPAGDADMWRDIWWAGRETPDLREDRREDAQQNTSLEMGQNTKIIRLFGIILCVLLCISLALSLVLHALSVIHSVIVSPSNSLSWHSIQVQEDDAPHEETTRRYVFICSVFSW